MRRQRFAYPSRVLDQQRHVGAVQEGYLGTGDGLEVEILRSLRKGHGSVHTVVVGQGEGRVAQRLRLEH